MLLRTFSEEKINSIIEKKKNLKSSIIGAFAEEMLCDELLSHPDITEVTELSIRDRCGDIKVVYKNTSILIECKSFLPDEHIRKFRDGTWEACVAGFCFHHKKPRKLTDGTILNTVHYLRHSFDILSVSTYKVDGNWNRFNILTQNIPSPNCPEYTEVQNAQLLARTLWIDSNGNCENTSGFVRDIFPLLEQVYVSKSHLQRTSQA